MYLRGPTTVFDLLINASLISNINIWTKMLMAVLLENYLSLVLSQYRL